MNNHKTKEQLEKELAEAKLLLVRWLSRTDDVNLDTCEWLKDQDKTEQS